MATLETYTYTREDLTEIINRGIFSFLDDMVKESIINAETIDILSGYSIVVTKKGVFGKFVDKLFKSDETKIITIKVLKDNV